MRVDPTAIRRSQRKAYLFRWKCEALYRMIYNEFERVTLFRTQGFSRSCCRLKLGKVHRKMVAANTQW